MSGVSTLPAAGLGLLSASTGQSGIHRSEDLDPPPALFSRLSFAYPTGGASERNVRIAERFGRAVAVVT